MTSKSELQLVLERRKKEQTQREEGELGRSPLEKEMLKRQQRHQQVGNENESTYTVPFIPHRLAHSLAQEALAFAIYIDRYI